MRRRGVLLTVLGFTVLGASSARAVDAPGTGGATTPSRHMLSASSDRCELVLKNEPLRPGMKTTLDLYLSDFQTNAPVRMAAITLSLRAGNRELWNGTAAATKQPGIYAVPLQAPADTGAYTVLATVTSPAGEERFALTGLEVTSGTNPGSASPRRGPGRLPLIGVGIGLLLVIAVVWRRRAAVAMAVLLLGLSLVSVVSAHEGHDDAPTASGAPVGPGAQIHVAKESQFLLGVLTEPLQRLPVQKRLSVMGRVAPRGGQEIEIVAPQSGRIYFADGRVPVIGLSVGKGQAVARLTVVDDLSLRAPVSGVLTGVFVVNGQLVEAGQKLMTLLDPTVVWVHADVYEADVSSVQQSTRAVITSSSMPDLALPGRRVALGVTQGEVPGAIEAWFEVPNTGGRLKVGALVDVGIEQGGADSALVVPRSAVFDKDGRKLVFVHTAPERFTARQVTLGTSLGARVAVTGDLKAGDRVVVAGGYPLLTAPVVSLGR